MPNLSRPKLYANDLGITDDWIITTLTTAIKALPESKKNRIVKHLESGRLFLYGEDSHYYLVKGGVGQLSYIATPRASIKGTIPLSQFRWPDVRADGDAWETMNEAVFRDLISAIEFFRPKHLPSLVQAIKGRTRRTKPNLDLDLF